MNIFRCLAALAVSLSCTVAHAACLPSAPAFSPSSLVSNPVSGSPPTSFVFQLALDCIPGDSAQITTSLPNVEAIVGPASSKDTVKAQIYKDSALTQPLYGSALAVAAVDTHPTTSLYVSLQGGSGNFSGMGPYSLSIPLTVTSGVETSTVNLGVSGSVVGTCSFNDASVDFGTVVTGTKPIQPVSLTLNCTNELAWTMSQPNIVSAGAGHSNTAWIFSNSAGTTAIFHTPINGVGTGAGQTVSVFAGLNGATLGTPISGTGQISGAIPITVTY